MKNWLKIKKKFITIPKGIKICDLIPYDTITSNKKQSMIKRNKVIELQYSEPVLRKK